MSRNFQDEILQLSINSRKNQNRHVNNDHFYNRLLDETEELFQKIIFNYEDKIRKSAAKNRTNCYLYFIKKDYEFELLTNNNIYNKFQIKPLYIRLMNFFENKNFKIQIGNDSYFGDVINISWNHWLSEN